MMPLSLPRPISSIANVGNAGPKPRIGWVDIARGIAICLVVFHHAVGAALKVGDLGEAARDADVMLENVRMPLFFFCSGLLAYWGLAKPWPTVLLNRGLVLAWVIAVWTIVFVALQQIIPINPWTEPHDLRFLFITPYVTLWFIYAILFMTLLMRALASHRIVTQVVVILVLSALLLVAYKIFEVRLFKANGGLWLLVSNLARYAMLYFAAGFWLAPMVLALFGARRRIIALLPIAVLAWVAEPVAREVLHFDLSLPRMIAGIPSVFLGLAVAALLSLWAPTRTVFGWLGTRTLEIFLLHSVLLGLGFMLIKPLGITSGAAALLLLFAFGLFGSIVAARLTRLAGLHFLYRPPEWVRRYVKGLLARLRPASQGFHDAPRELDAVVPQSRSGLS